jgi:hypothetical protein
MDKNLLIYGRMFSKNITPRQKPPKEYFDLNFSASLFLTAAPEP